MKSSSGISQTARQSAQRKGYEKVVNSCKQARLDGFSWIWIDTCCIDKTSSSELSEAINSMFRWYREARICYAFIADVSSLANGDVLEEFKRSRWLTQGWTLQELIAPDLVEFYDKHWIEIGTKATLRPILHDATGIDLRVLSGEPVSDCNVATRLSWAARRQTTREEDRAYSLLGLLEVNMALLYGEGMNAFKRLQEEVLKNSTDYTMFAWRDHEGLPIGSGMLAPSLGNFCTPRFCSFCAAEGFEYQKIGAQVFSSADKHRGGIHVAELEGAHIGVLPAFMGDRLQMIFPTSPALNIGNASLEGGKDDQLLYLEYQTAETPEHPGPLICLELRPDWSRRGDFYRNRMVLVPLGSLSTFALRQLILVAWRNMSFALGNSLRASMSARFVFEDWPLCLTAKEGSMRGISTALDADFGHEGGRFGSLLHSYSPLAIFCEHGHDEDDVEELITVQCDNDRRGPTCSIMRGHTPEVQQC